MKKLILSIGISIALVNPIKIYPNSRENFDYNGTEVFAHIVKDCLLAYTVSLISTVVHEIGHAVAVKTAYGPYNEIGIGGSVKDPSYITIPWFNIKFKGLSPFIGYCRYSSLKIGSTKKDQVKRMAISAAGPLSGIAASIILYLSIPNKYIISKGISFGVLENNILNAYPNGKSNDGQKFYNAYKRYKNL